MHSPFASLPSLASLPVALVTFVAALAAGGGAACTTRTTGTPTESTPTAPAAITTSAPGACEAGAIAQISGGYTLNPGDARGVTVDAAGVLLELTNAAGNSVLASGTSAGGFSVLTTIPSGGIEGIGTTASAVFFVGDGVVSSIPRAGGAVQDLGVTDENSTSFALGASTVYEATFTGISSMPTSGGSMTVIHPGGSALDMVISDDGSSLYWATGDTLGPYYIRTSPLTGPFTATTVATMPDGALVSNIAVGGGQLVITATTLSPSLATELFTVSTAGGTPVSVDLFPVSLDAGATTAPRLAIANGVAYYSLGAGLKTLALDGSNTTETVAAPSSAIAGIGANPLGSGAIYVVGQCVYATPG